MIGYFAGNIFIWRIGPYAVTLSCTAFPSVTVTVTQKSTITLYRVTASSGLGARSELWPTRNFQASLGNYVSVDNPFGLVTYSGTGSNILSENKYEMIMESIDYGSLSVALPSHGRVWLFAIYEKKSKLGTYPLYIRTPPIFLHIPH